MPLICHQVDAAAAAIRATAAARPRLGVILGTGMSTLAETLDDRIELPYERIPHFAKSTAPTHRGALALGHLNQVPVAVLAGRFHGYEGYSASQIAFPVRVLAALGIDTLVVTNACGGMHPDYRVGDVMLVEDQLNFTFASPLVGPHDAQVGMRHPDMSRPFDRVLLNEAARIARHANFVAHRGVYVGVLGPNYETRAEYRMFRRLGGDAVGMSTIHEVIAARQCGLRVLALSIVTNECRPEALDGADSHEVECAATASAPKLRAIIHGIAATLPPATG